MIMLPFELHRIKHLDNGLLSAVSQYPLKVYRTDT